MKIVLQRVSQAQVCVQNEIVGKIGKGLLLLICFEKKDENLDLVEISEKLLSLRVFEDPENGKMNHNIFQAEGSLLCISQFTLSWNGKKGNRPSFDQSMHPERARRLFEELIATLSEKVKVETGVFGEHMDVSLTNDGPVTFHLDF